MSLILRIISGGQSGADQGGLEAAKQLGIPTGGWMPRGFLTESGLRPEFADLYGMLECPEVEYSPRTETNVVDGDGTVIFGDVILIASRTTQGFCVKHRKPCHVVSWRSGQPVPLDAAAGFRRWISENNVRILNVAGNYESRQPGIREATKNFLVAALSNVEA